MAKKCIGDYIEYDFHTHNSKEIRDYLEKEFVVTGNVREWNDNKRYLTCSVDKDYIYATDTAWEHYIPTETFKEMVGMKKEKKKGCELADGTYSSEYKIGDKFVVTTSSDSFSKGSVVSFFYDDGTYSPLFKLEQGHTNYTLDSGEKGAYAAWGRLKPFVGELSSLSLPSKQTSTKVAFTKSSLKDGMVVTTRNGNVYTVKGDELLREGGMFIHLDNFEDDLTCAGVDQLDVMWVQETTTLFKRETERDSKQQRIAKELEFAEAKRERLNAHIERLKRNLQN